MFKDYLKDTFNETRTENNAKAFKSTKSYVLDLFALGGSARDASHEELREMIVQAFNENPELAAKTVFYLGDIRGGQGFRDILKVGLEVMVERYPKLTAKIMYLIPEFSRWDLMYEFVGTKLEEMAFIVMREVAFKAHQQEKSHLIFKWLKSPKTSSRISTELGRLTAKKFGLTEKEYRKFLVANRKRLNLVETKMSQGDFSEIDYSALPSKASLKYRQAFYRNDLERYQRFLDAVQKGEATMNMSVTYPHEIVSKYRDGRYHGEIKLNSALEAMWKSLPELVGTEETSILPVVDVSGSMFTQISRDSSIEAIDVSIALGIYTSEKIKGYFHNMFLTFSEKTEFVQLSDRDSLRDKISRTSKAPWGFNTDIDNVFRKVLHTAVRNRVPQKDLPKTILIISDMQFDQCSNLDTTNFRAWEQEFAREGYQLPIIVFWQVTSQKQVPIEMHSSNSAIVSGFSPSVLEFIYKGEIKTPYEFMLEVINTERYDEIGEVFSQAK